MLVNLNVLLQNARKTKKAIPAFNVYNLETVQAVLEASERQRSPVIIALGESYISYVPIQVLASIVMNMTSFSDLPVVLHLDHAKNISSIIRAIQCGFTSVMYDGSGLPLSENIQNTLKVVEYAHAVDVSVEGELGYMNMEDGILDAGKSPITGYTRPQDAQDYVKSTGVDALAIAIGNAHGIYKGTPELDFNTLIKIHQATDVPLVLHGCSGIPDEMIKKAAEMGVCKINVNTELSLSAVKATRNFLETEETTGLRYEKVLAYARNHISDTAERYLELFK